MQTGNPVFDQALQSPPHSDGDDALVQYYQYQAQPSWLDRTATDPQVYVPMLLLLLFVAWLMFVRARGEEVICPVEDEHQD